MKKGFLGPYIIASAVIWGATIIGASFLLHGVENKAAVLNLLGAGAGVHLILIWGALAAKMKKLSEQPEEAQK